MSEFRIPYAEIILEPTSSLDNTGKVFRWKNEVYRGIYDPHAAFYKQLFSSSLGEELIDLGLVPTQYVPYHLNGFDLILKHKTIPIISYANEWSSAMLKDAALLTCDIQLRLVESGYTLKDAHPWNILFDACRPIFVDVGSITEKRKVTLRFFLNQFRLTFLYPLLLKSGKFYSIVDARMAVHCGMDDMPVYKMLFLQSSLSECFYHWRQQRKINSIWHKSPINGLKLLREQVEAISYKSKYLTTANCPPDRRSIKEGKKCSSRNQAIDELLTKLQPASLLDIGFKDGSNSILAAGKGIRVIAVDKNDLYVNDLYHRAGVHQFDILPLRMDITEPTMAHGWGTHTSAQHRLKADMVLMLSLSKYLLQKQSLTFDHIALYASRFTNKWALLEIVLPNDDGLSFRNNQQTRNHGFNILIETFRKYFSDVVIYRQIDDKTYLILCSST